MPSKAPDSSYEVPKRTADVERDLRQFTNTDGPKGASDAYREGWERTFAPKPAHARLLNCGPDRPDCRCGICSGALFVCAVCGQAEAELEPHCPIVNDKRIEPKYVNDECDCSDCRALKGIKLFATLGSFNCPVCGDPKFNCHHDEP